MIAKYFPIIISVSLKILLLSKKFIIRITGVCIYGTARFKLHTRECITRVYLVTTVEYFRKSHMFEDTCTANSRALHARLWHE